MIISGIEVIRGNRTQLNPGFLVQVLPGEKVELTYGESLHVNVSLDYKGPKLDATLYGAIGTRGIGFTEKVVGEADVTFPKADAFTPWFGSVDIPITADIKPGTDYDLYCKIKEYPGAGMPEVDNVITITGIPPTYELIQHTISHFAYIYNGDAEVNITTFKIDPFTPSAWAAKKFTDALESEARKKGARVLETKVYVDTTPLLWTDIRIEVTGTPLGGEVSTVAAIGIAPWLAIILVCLAIIAVIVVATLAFKTIMEAFKKKPGLEDMKPTWKKEALILDIQDTEGWLEQPGTPTETLEEMSEEELRVYLDELAKKVVPPVPDWTLAIVAAGVLGLGALAVMAMGMGKPKERG